MQELEKKKNNRIVLMFAFGVLAFFRASHLQQKKNQTQI